MGSLFSERIGARGVVDVPCVVNEMHLWCPYIAAPTGRRIRPHQLGLAILQAVKRPGPRHAQVDEIRGHHEVPPSR